MTETQKIPFLDLVSPHLKLEEELVAVFREVLRSGQFIGGNLVDRFEDEFARFCNTDYAVGVGSGTDALRFSLMAAGIRQGDIVITVPNTFIATTEAISQAGAMPDFVDIDERTYTIAPHKLLEYLQTFCFMDDKTGRVIHRQRQAPVSAVIPVHLYGQMAPMDAILEIASKFHLTVIEDACQAHGAQYESGLDGTRVPAGSIGAAAAFSFYPGKILGACGEAGAITTNDAQLAEQARMLRDHGQIEKYHHEIEGYNGRLDALQAGILTVKLKRLAGWVARRRQVAAWYNDELTAIDAITPPGEHAGSRGAYHLYVIRTPERDNLMQHLRAQGIDVGLHYPVPLHRQKAYAAQAFSFKTFPVAEKVAGEILSLPIFPELQQDEVALIARTIRDFFKA